MKPELTVIGGGIGGLVAAIAAQEQGWQASIYESGSQLGGRARTTGGDYHANWGPHVLYCDGPLWTWLAERSLVDDCARAPLVPALRFRVDGHRRRTPPVATTRALLKMHRVNAPVDQSYQQWATQQFGEPAMHRLSALAGVFTFDHDPGRLSAAFVHDRLRRVVRIPAQVRYVPGGWVTLVDRLAHSARQLGVMVHTHSKIEELPGGPTVIAVKLAEAARLLGDSSLTPRGTTTALLDIGVAHRRADPFIVADLDEGGWVERFSAVDATLAPSGHQLLQGQIGMRPDELLPQAIERLEQLLDVGFNGWRERETWRRQARLVHDSGALDLPGTTWQDRPAVDRGDGVYLVGDMVAAPGLLSEVSFNSAIMAVGQLSAARPRITAAS